MLEQTTAETKYTGLSMVRNFFNTDWYKQLNMVSDSRGLSKDLQDRKAYIHHTQDWFPYLNAMHFGTYLVSMLL